MLRSMEGCNSGRSQGTHISPQGSNSLAPPCGIIARSIREWMALLSDIHLRVGMHSTYGWSARVHCKVGEVLDIEHKMGDRCACIANNNVNKVFHTSVVVHARAVQHSWSPTWWSLVRTFHRKRYVI
jgi:hypothetical protein